MRFGCIKLCIILDAFSGANRTQTRVETSQLIHLNQVKEDEDDDDDDDVPCGAACCLLLNRTHRTTFTSIAIAIDRATHTKHLRFLFVFNLRARASVLTTFSHTTSPTKAMRACNADACAGEHKRATSNV